jgi:uridylate kinase
LGEAAFNDEEVEKGSGALYPSKLERVVLKLSGESLAGKEGYGVDPESLESTTTQVVEAVETGAELAVVVGGGNIFRGSGVASNLGIESATADYMAMLGTVINAMALQAALESRDVPTRVQSAIQIQEVAEPYIRRRAIRHLQRGRVVIFASGTGNPFFTTDTGAALRALEIGADAILMAKNRVDGVYDKDPRFNSDASHIPYLSYMDLLSKNLSVMDHTAATLCGGERLPILIFDILKPGNLRNVLKGERVGSLIWNGEQGG